MTHLLSHNSKVYLRYLAAILLPIAAIFFLSSCSDDNDLPDVDISMTYSGAVKVDGTLYASNEEPMQITSLSATAVRPDKNAAITGVTYSLDGWVVAVTNQPPFAVEFDTSSLQPGRHLLTMSMTVAEEGCELAVAYQAVTLQIVPTDADIPATPGDGTETTLQAHPSVQAN